MGQERLHGVLDHLASTGEQSHPVVERLVDVADVRGRISVAASLSGNARQPDISGGLQLEGGAFSVPAAGITVDRIGLALEGQPDGRVGIKGSARWVRRLT